MATLYQTLVNQGVSSGNTYNVQKQLYEKLGSPLGPYKGTYDQNIWLQGKLGNQNYNDILNPRPQQSAPQQSSASTSSNPLEAVNKVIEDSFQKLQSDVMAKFGEYRSGKPFRIDEVLAEKGTEAKEQIDPYYNELLGDYLLGVTRKINRSTDDTKDLLDELTATTDSYTGSAKIALNQSINQAQEGFADSGLFESGKALAGEGQLRYDTGRNLDEYTRKSELQKKQLTTGLGRTLEDINSDKVKSVRDLERSRLTDIETRKGDLAKEAGQQYIQGFKATLPPQLQAASGFDLLKDLGIYS